MVVLFVFEDWSQITNPVVINANKIAKELIKTGDQVKFLGLGVKSGIEYMYNIPLFASRETSINFTKELKKHISVIDSSLEGVDVVHTFSYNKLCRFVTNYAKGRNIAVTTSVVVPSTYENKFGSKSSIHWQKANSVYYKKVSYAHCSSYFLFELLRKKGYHNKFHVFPNIINEEFIMNENFKINHSQSFNIISVGPLEKCQNQKEIIKAISLSRYVSFIYLTIIGTGPMQDFLMKYAKKLKVNLKIISKPQTNTQLREILYQNDLFIQSSTVDFDGEFCLGAMSCGIPCLLARSKKSITMDFCVDEQTSYQVFDLQTIKKRIEHFYENRNDLERIRILSLQLLAFYTSSNIAVQFKEMLKDAIRAIKISNLTKTSLNAQNMKNMMKKSFVPAILSFLMYYVIALPILIIIMKTRYLMKITGKKYIKEVKKKRIGAVSISNHIHNLDAAMVAVPQAPKKITFTALPTNFTRKDAGFLVNLLGAVPIPVTVDENKIFFYELGNKLVKEQMIHFYPEGGLVQLDTHLRDFKTGAFLLASQNLVPIIPMFISYKLTKNKEHVKRIYLTIAKAIYPNYLLPLYLRSNDLYQRCFLTMKQLNEQALTNN